MSGKKAKKGFPVINSRLDRSFLCS